jgi:hypothetical protein
MLYIRRTSKLYLFFLALSLEMENLYSSDCQVHVEDILSFLSNISFNHYNAVSSISCKLQIRTIHHERYKIMSTYLLKF